MTAIYFAGADLQRDQMQQLCELGVEHILVSFFYIFMKQRDGFIEQYQKKYPKVEWMLDSGAYSLIKYLRGKKGSFEGLVQGYAENYIKYVEHNANRYSKLAELDLDVADVPMDQVEEWRIRLFRYSNDIIPVWHEERGVPYWKQLCTDPKVKHLGISSHVDNEGLLRKMIAEARNSGKTVHGFGVGKLNILEKQAYSTVDCTTWKTGDIYGNTFLWEGNKFIILDRTRKAERKKYRKYFASLGLDSGKIEADDGEEVRKLNILSWKRLSLVLREKAKRYEETKARGTIVDRAVQTFFAPKER